nr:type I-C CRISPR-associated protein Cas5c [Schleiferilactobacillus perolens]
MAVRVWGALGLITDPSSRGMEKSTYPLPTQQCLLGILESCYWKPSVHFFVDRVRVLHQIQMRPISQLLMRMEQGGKPAAAKDLAYYTYLVEPAYEIYGRMMINYNQINMKEDQNIQKHDAIFRRVLKSGGRRDVFIGTRECQGYVGPIRPDETGYYDDSPASDYGWQYVRTERPIDTGKNEEVAVFGLYQMDHGWIDFDKIAGNTYGQNTPLSNRQVIRTDVPIVPAPDRKGRG